MYKRQLEAFGACAEGGGDIDDIGNFVPADTVIEEHDLGGVGRRIAGDEGSNLRLDVGVNTLIMQVTSARATWFPSRAFVASLNGSRTRRISAGLPQSWFVIVMPAPPARSFAYIHITHILVLICHSLPNREQSTRFGLNIITKRSLNSRTKWQTMDY